MGEIDHALARQTVEAVAHRCHADPELIGDLRRLQSAAGRPAARHQPAHDGLISRLDDMRGAHAPLRSAAAQSASIPIWSGRSEEHTSELQSLLPLSYTGFRLK